MNIYEVIKKKRDSGELSSEQIKYWVKGAVSGEVADYQSAALLMAIFIRGLNKRETADLTWEMMHSGQVLDLSDIKGIKVDKHSTGGVGDKTTLIIAPVLAAAGLKVAKMSGRGLGHTGGTIDKLESIKGFNAELEIDEFFRSVNSAGLAVIGQTAEVAPADKIFYSLRDVTATVDSIPLIAASIMSKKLALGADHIVLDVTYGDGAFMKNIDDARSLAKQMVEIAHQLNKNASAVVSSMDAPLGHAVGNALEVHEALAILRNEPFAGFTKEADKELMLVSMTLAAELMLQAGLVDTLADGVVKGIELISSGAAFEKFRLMVELQGGDTAYVDNPQLLAVSAYNRDFVAPKAGFIRRFKAEEVGLASLALGAGRHKKSDAIDYGAGLIIYKNVGDWVDKGDKITTGFAADEKLFESSFEHLRAALEIGPNAPLIVPQIAEIIRNGN